MIGLQNIFYCQGCLDERYCSRLEVRVGDTDVAALGEVIPTVDHLKMCANRLCFTSGLQMGTARILQQQAFTLAMTKFWDCHGTLICCA